MPSREPDNVRCRLFLVAPPQLDSDRLVPLLEAAFDAGDVASLLLCNSGSAEPLEETVRAAMQIAYARNVALLVADDADLAVRSGADGVHVTGGLDAYRAARATVGPERIAGALCRNGKHLAMELGEAGADYLAFEDGAAGTDSLLAWWAEIFEVPCLAATPTDLALAGVLARAGVDFIRPEDAMWGSSQRAAEAVRRYNELFDEIAAEQRC